MSAQTTIQRTASGYNAARTTAARNAAAATTSKTTNKTTNSSTTLNTALSTGTYAKQAVSSYIGSNDKNKDGWLSRDEVKLSDEAYAKLDANSDGKVARSELLKALQGKDSQIYQYYQSGGAKAHPKDVVATLLSNASTTTSSTSVEKAATQYVREHDRNKDGKLSRAETTLSAEEYAKLDTDGDGKLTRSELTKALNGKGAAIDQYFASGAEKTHDGDMVDTVLFASNAGKISDFSALAASRFLQDKDKNGDQSLSLGEAGLALKVFNKIDKDGDKKISAGELRAALAGKNAAIQKYYKNGGAGSLVNLTSSLLKTI